jgi:plasmid stabilization system protein ParE
MLIKWSYSAEKDLEIIFQFYLKTWANGQKVG